MAERKPVTENIVVSLSGGDELPITDLEKIVKTCRKIPFLPVPKEILHEKVNRILVGVNNFARGIIYDVYYDFKDGCVRAYQDSTQAKMD